MIDLNILENWRRTERILDLAPFCVTLNLSAALLYFGVIHLIPSAFPGLRYRHLTDSFGLILMLTD